MRATIKMIAQRAGVSIGTVDRVLHDRPYVKEDVRRRVLQAVEELDYRPNHVARALAMHATPHQLAVIQPEWARDAKAGLEQGVARFQEERRDYNIRLSQLTYRQNDTGKCLKLLDEAAESGARGIALCATDCPEIREKLAELAEKHIPVVTFNSDIAESARLCYVGENARQAGRIAGELAAALLPADARLLVVYAGPAYSGHKGRAEGFLERVREKGFPMERCRVSATHNDYEETYQAVKEALEAEKSTALIYMANLSVPACVSAIDQCGRTGRVRVICHDSWPEICALLKTGQVHFTIGQDLAYQTWQALTLLYRATAEGKLPEQTYYYSASPILNAETV